MGRFELGEELARGGMGVVYEARDPKRDERVAIKVLLAEALLSPLRRKRLAREIEALRRVDHPNVVKLVDAGIARSGAPYLAMERVEGDSLKVHLRQGPLEVRQAAQHALALANAVAACHAAGILHRDLKPSNVLLQPDGRLVLVDFGLVRDTDPETSRTRLTLDGGVMGTPGYWAPEQAMGRLDAIGPATDVYGLGATLYALLTAHPPRRPKTLEEALHLARTPPPSARSARPDVPLELDALCQGCLAPDPGQRPELAEVISALGAWLTGAPGGARTEARRAPSRLLALALAATALAVLSGAWAVRPAKAPGVAEQTTAGLRPRVETHSHELGSKTAPTQSTPTKTASLVDLRLIALTRCATLAASGPAQELIAELHQLEALPPTTPEAEARHASSIVNRLAMLLVTEEPGEPGIEALLAAGRARLRGVDRWQGLALVDPLYGRLTMGQLSGAEYLRCLRALVELDVPFHGGLLAALERPTSQGDPIDDYLLSLWRQQRVLISIVDEASDERALPRLGAIEDELSGRLRRDPDWRAHFGPRTQAQILLVAPVEHTEAGLLEANELDRQNPHVARCLSSLAYDVGDLPQARAWIEQAYAMVPTHYQGRGAVGFELYDVCAQVIDFHTWDGDPARARILLAELATRPWTQPDDVAVLRANLEEAAQEADAQVELAVGGQG